MIGARQNFQHLPHHAMLFLDRLIRIGVGANSDGARLITRRRQFALQQSGGAVLHKQPRFKIEPGRQAHKGVAGPRETIDAAMLATAIGIDRAIKGNVRRFITRDDDARGLVRDVRFQRR